MEKNQDNVEPAPFNIINEPTTSESPESKEKTYSLQSDLTEDYSSSEESESFNNRKRKKRRKKKRRKKNQFKNAVETGEKEDMYETNSVNSESDINKLDLEDPTDLEWDQEYCAYISKSSNKFKLNPHEKLKPMSEMILWNNHDDHVDETVTDISSTSDNSCTSSQSENETSSYSESEESTISKMGSFDIRWFVEGEQICAVKKCEVNHGKLEELSFKIVSGKLTQEVKRTSNNMGLVILRGEIFLNVEA